MHSSTQAIHECVLECASVPVTGPGGLIIQAVLNLHSSSPLQPAHLMVNTNEFCIFTMKPRACVRKRGEDKRRVTERESYDGGLRQINTAAKWAEGKNKFRSAGRAEERDWETWGRLLGWRGIEKERRGACSVLRCPISQDRLTVFVMLGFSPCCFSKVACTDFCSNLHLTDIMTHCTQSLETRRWTLVVLPWCFLYSLELHASKIGLFFSPH